MNAEELLIADKEYRRLDLCLSEMTELSRSRAQSLIEEGLVSINGRPCRRSDTRCPKQSPSSWFRRTSLWISYTRMRISAW